MDSPVTEALTRLIHAYAETAGPGDPIFPPEIYDPDWPSPCILGAPDGSGQVNWQPVRQQPPVDFRGLENALEVEIHVDLKAFYGSYWSATLEATCKEGPVSLLQLWNPIDFDRLIENLIGHALAKRQQKQPLTLFFANTGLDSEYFLSVDNTSGEVLLEEPGRPPVRVVDQRLVDFLRRLSPSRLASGIH